MGRSAINDYYFYKITCDDCPDYVYIGSTCNPIRRKCSHKFRCNHINDKNYNNRLYQTIRQNGGWEKWNMVIIDKEEQLTLTDARIKEEALRKEYNGNLNMKKAYKKEEEFKEYYKEYYQNNKEMMKDYREKNKEILKEKNKEKIKEYYENNRDIILAKWKEKVTCICGCVTSKGSLFGHLKTPKHFNLLKMKNAITESENY